MEKMEIEKNLEKSLTWSSVGDLHPKKEPSDNFKKKI